MFGGFSTNNANPKPEAERTEFPTGNNNVYEFQWDVQGYSDTMNPVDPDMQVDNNANNASPPFGPSGKMNAGQ